MWVVSVSRWLKGFIVGPINTSPRWQNDIVYHGSRPHTKYIFLDIPETTDYLDIQKAMNSLTEEELERLYSNKKALIASEMMLLLQSLK